MKTCLLEDGQREKKSNMNEQDSQDALEFYLSEEEFNQIKGE